MTDPKLITKNYTDEDITFFLGLYRDLDRAEGALCRLREHFPDARVIVRSDGDRNPKNRELSERYDVEYLEEERLYPIENGGAMVARILELCLDKPTRYLIKIDTDTAVYRRFHFLPEQNGVFGTKQSNRQGHFHYIQGGCMGFSEDATRLIVDSGVLEDPRLKDPKTYRLESGYFRRMSRRVHRTGLCSFDWIIGWAASELEIPIFAFSEVFSRGFPENNVNNDDLKYAITHPVYF